MIFHAVWCLNLKSSFRPRWYYCIVVFIDRLHFHLALNGHCHSILYSFENIEFKFVSMQVLRRPLHIPSRPTSGPEGETEITSTTIDDQNQEDVKMAFTKIVEAFKVYELVLFFNIIHFNVLSK